MQNLSSEGFGIPRNARRSRLSRHVSAMSSMSRRLSDKRNLRTASITYLFQFYPIEQRLVPLCQNSWIHNHICNCCRLRYILLSTADEFPTSLRHALGHFITIFGLSKYILSQQLPLSSTLTKQQHCAPRFVARSVCLPRKNEFRHELKPSVHLSVCRDAIIRGIPD